MIPSQITTLTCAQWNFHRSPSDFELGETSGFVNGLGESVSTEIAHLHRDGTNVHAFQSSVMRDWVIKLLISARCADGVTFSPESGNSFSTGDDIYPETWLLGGATRGSQLTAALRAGGHHQHWDVSS